ncbi:MAG: hypothetical protein ABW252_05150 [Polyangiales bacterium]
MTIALDHGVTYFGHRRNVRLRNEEVELVLPTEFGPRVMRYARLGGENVLAEIDPTSQRVATPYGDDWHIYGGHRLWLAPEHAERSYYPDNAPVALEELASGVRLRQEVEAHTGIEKQLAVELAPQGSKVRVTHSLTNRGHAPRELSPWALTAMRPGGRAIFPHAPFVPHPTALAPARPLVLWPFTRMADPRWTWGDRTFCLRQDPALEAPQKVGCYDLVGAMAYALPGETFLKRHEPRSGRHADFGCNVQTFTNAHFLELETLGPMVVLAPQQSVEHVEHWRLFEGDRFDGDDDARAAALAALIAAP